jgi:uncharacterized damage-inducible protein DinB
MVDIKELLAYNERLRHEYFETFAKLPWKELTKNREASFQSMKNILVHTLGAIDYWLDILQEQNLHARKDYDDYKSLEQVKAYMEQVEKRMHTYLRSLSPQKLKKTYALKDDRGKTQAVTAEDILIHVFEEEVHHRGELNALLWQIGVDPPLMGWKYL